VVNISRELNRLDIKPRKGKMWKGNTIYNIITNPIYAGFVRWGGEMAEGSHKSIIEKEVFECAQETLKQRNHQTRQLRGPNYLTGLVRCGKCGSPMHVNYPGAESKRKFKYYVCNNRYNFQSCDQDYVRADVLEQSVIKEIGKLSERQDVITELVRDYVTHNRAKLPKLVEEKKRIMKEMELLEKEKAKLSRWLLNNELTPQSVSYINAQIDGYGEKETELQERLWEIEDKISVIQKETVNAEGVGDYLKDFVRSFEESDTGERVLLVQSLVTEVVIKPDKKATVCLQPPFGFLSPSLARRGEKPKMDFSLYIEYNLTDYYNNVSGQTWVFSEFSKQEYII